MNGEPVRRSLTLAALAMAALVGLSLPGLYLFQAVSNEKSASQATTRAYVIALNRVVSRYPNDWRFQDHLLRDVVKLGQSSSSAGERAETIRIVGLKGEEILATSDLPPEPRFTHRADLSDSGVTVGAVEYSVSLQPLWKSVLGVTALGLLLGALVYVVLRQLPLRAVERALAALQQEVTRAEAALAEKAGAEKTLRDNEAQLRHRAQTDQLLESLAVAANTARSPEEAISQCLQRLCEFTGWPLGHAALVERFDGYAVARAEFWHGTDDGKYDRFVEATKGYKFDTTSNTFVGRALRENQPVWLRNLQFAGRFKNMDRVEFSGLASGVCFPVARGVEVIGFFEFFTQREIDRDDALAEVILRASAHVGRVAERVAASEEVVRLNADLERRVAERGTQMERSNALLTIRNRETTLLAEMTSVLQIATDLDEAGNLVARFMPAILRETEGGSLYLMRASRDHLERLSQWGDARGPTSFPPSHCWGMRRGQTHSSSLGNVPLQCAHLASGDLAEGSLCLPLIAQGDSLGLLQIAYAGQLDPKQWKEAVDAAKRTAEQLSLALANVRLRESLREQSIRDSLTSLYNRRYLEESLRRELARCMREKQPLALFMLDVDHFKRYNDMHGHDGGDAALRELGRELRENARASDIICRYGGEEFTAVLPNTSEDEASAWSERFMRKVRSMEIRLGSRGLPPFTVSMGLAVCPQHGTTVEQLTHAADTALYEAKHAGRDRLTIVKSSVKSAANVATA